MSLIPLQSDSFNSADGPLFNRVPDNALGGSDAGGWLDQIGSHGSEIVSNCAVNTDTPTGGIHVSITQAAPSTDCRVTGICYGQNIGVVARFKTATSEFYVYGGTSGGSTLYYFDGAAFNTIAGGGPGLADTDSIALAPEGTNLTCYKNGSVAIATQPHSGIASGKYGFYSEGGGAGFDSILCELGTVSAAVADRLIVATQPVGNQSNVAFPTQPVVNVADSSAATVTSDTSTVSVALVTVSGSGTLGGTTTAAASSGVATFSGLKVTGAGSFKLRFTDGSLTLADSALFYVGATQLVVTTPSTAASAFSGHASTVVVTAKDAGGTTVANYTGTVSVATLTKTSGSVAELQMSLGTRSAAAVAGVATLSLIALASEGATYNYTATATGLSAATTPDFTSTISESIAVTIT